MCGDHHHRNSLGGALVVLSPYIFGNSTTPLPLHSRLVFHSRGKQSSIATHAVYTVDSPLGHHPSNLQPCLVRIHQTGDLTRPAAESPSWATFSLRPVVEVPRGIGKGSVEYELERPVKMEVGDDGIIGRRVSVWMQQGVEPLAEGIVGFN